MNSTYFCFEIYSAFRIVSCVAIAAIPYILLAKSAAIVVFYYKQKSIVDFLKKLFSNTDKLIAKLFCVLLLLMLKYVFDRKNTLTGLYEHKQIA